MKFRSLLSFICAFSAFSSIHSAYALRLDNFSTQQFVFSTGPGNVQSDSKASAGSVGGFRSVDVSIQSGSGLLFIVQSGILSHSQSAQVIGRSITTWDGNINGAWL